VKRTPNDHTHYSAHRVSAASRYFRRGLALRPSCVFDQFRTCNGAVRCLSWIRPSTKLWLCLADSLFESPKRHFCPVNMHSERSKITSVMASMRHLFVFTSLPKIWGHSGKMYLQPRCYPQDPSNSASGGRDYGYFQAATAEHTCSKRPLLLSSLRLTSNNSGGCNFLSPCRTSPTMIGPST
jgi:hypothetical protein